MAKKTPKKKTASHTVESQSSHLKSFLVVGTCVLIVSLMIPVILERFQSSLKTGHNLQKSSTSSIEVPIPTRSETALVALFDSFLMTALYSRPSLDSQTMNSFLRQLAKEVPEFDIDHPLVSSAEEGTGGHLTPLGYAVLLHDIELVKDLLSSNSSTEQLPIGLKTPNPMAYVGQSPQMRQASPEKEGILLGSFHESALSDGLRPLHLALMTKVPHTHTHTHNPSTSITSSGCVFMNSRFIFFICVRCTFDCLGRVSGCISKVLIALCTPNRLLQLVFTHCSTYPCTACTVRTTIT